MAIRSMDRLQNVFKDVLRRMNPCLDINGGQIKNML